MNQRFISFAGLALCGVLAAGSAAASPPNPASSTVPCAIVLVGHDFAATQADPYGQFIVIARDVFNAPEVGATISVDLSACCPDIKLSNTQLGAGVSHVPNSAIVRAITDVTGTATFRIEGAASQGGGPNTGSVNPLGCATISATPLGGAPEVLTSTVLVATPDENGAAGTTGVDATDLSVFVGDKNAYTVSQASYRQRSDFDFHLPTSNCSLVFNATFGYGDNLGDLTEWVHVKNAQGSFANGPFPASCP